VVIDIKNKEEFRKKYNITTYMLYKLLKKEHFNFKGIKTLNQVAEGNF